MIQKFLELCDENDWDAAIDYVKCATTDIPEHKRDDIYLLVDIYERAYDTTHYEYTDDPEEGLTYSIREFAIRKITEILEVNTDVL